MNTLKLMFGITSLGLAAFALAGEAKPSAQLDVAPDQAVQQDADGEQFKLFEYQGEKFKVFAPKDDRIAVEGMGLTAYISIHEATGKYREEFDGWGQDWDSPKDALDNACRRIMDRAKTPGEAELRKGLDELFEELK